MVKSGLIFVILVIGYFDANRVLARVPNDVEVFSETLMSLEDELLPSKVEEGYQNDEPLGQEEGSGFAPQEEVGGEYVPDQPVEEDAISKEKDQQSAADEHNNQDKVVNGDDEEDLNVAPITEEEPSKDVETADGNGEFADEDDTSTQVEQSEDEKTIDESLDKEEDTSKMQEEQTESSEYDVKTAEGNAETPDEEDDNSKMQEASEQQAEPLEDDDKTVEVTAETSDEENDTSKTQEAPTDEIALDPIVEEGMEQSQPIYGEEDSVKPDTIEETNPNESENITDNKDDTIQDPIAEIVGGGELEHQELEPAVVHEDNKEEQTLQRLVKTTKFANEHDLPAERLNSTVRGMVLMPMQEEAKRDGEEVKKETETGNEGADSRIEQQNGVDKEKIEEQTEMEDSGASSASSGSNAVTFVVILGIVCVVGIVGFFIHKKRRRTQRATAVPTHEDRELKEVKTHRSSESDDDGAAKKQASSHIPEANPLILTNSHFKRNVDIAAQEQQQNGHLPTDQQQQALLTTLLATTKQQKDADDIRMMDEDAEEEGAERRPLVMSSFKPNIQISGAIAIKVGAKVELGKDSDAATGEDL